MSRFPGGTHIAAAEYLLGTWPGGTTHAILAHPPESLAAPADAHYWAGTALIARAAPYSYFPQRVRLHLPIHGDGVRLHFREPDELATLDRLMQLRFDGARPVGVELQAGPVIAFNLIVRTDILAEAKVAHIGAEPLMWAPHVPPALEAGPAGLTALRLIYVISGALEVRVGLQGDAATLATDDSLALDPCALPVAPLSLAAGTGPAEVVLATMWLRAQSGPTPTG